MECPTIINWMNPFRILGLLDSKFQLIFQILIFILYANSEEPE